MSSSPKQKLFTGKALFRERQNKDKAFHFCPKIDSISNETEKKKPTVCSLEYGDDWDFGWNLICPWSDDESPEVVLPQEQPKYEHPDPDIVFADSPESEKDEDEGDVSTTPVPSDTDDTDPTWKWRKRYGDSCDVEYLEGKWEEVTSKYRPESD